MANALLGEIMVTRRLTVLSTLFGAMIFSAARHSGTLAHCDQDILLVVNNASRRLIDSGWHETPAGSLLSQSWDKVVYLNAFTMPEDPSRWNVRKGSEQPVAAALLRACGLPSSLAESDELELVLETIHLPPARTLAQLFPRSPITVLSEGLMSYGPTRQRLNSEVTGRIIGHIHIDLVPGLTPMLLAEVGIQPTAVPLNFLRTVAQELVPAYRDARPSFSGRYGTTDVVLVSSQYLAAGGVLTNAEELGLGLDMIRFALEQLGPNVVFKVHPTADRRQTQRLIEEVSNRRWPVTFLDEPIPAEVLAELITLSATVTCFSTSALTLHGLHGIPMHAVGTVAAMRALNPFAAGNRIPLVIMDYLAAPDAERSTLTLHEVVDTVAYAMQPQNAAYLRPKAIAALERMSPRTAERYIGQTYLKQIASDTPPCVTSATHAQVKATMSPPYQFSVAVTAHNTARYLPAALRSLEWQTYGLENLEIIIVDDGSTDDSPQIAEAWAAGRRNVRVIRQENTGRGDARNRAIELARGTWFTSLDSDDILRREYFDKVAEVLHRDTEHRASVLAPNLQMLDDKTGRYHNTHALCSKFSYGAHLARLADEPEAFILGTPFLELATLKEHDLRYDTRIKPNFDDGHLIGRYLAHWEDPVVALIPGAHYYCRQRTRHDSLVESSWSRSERFDVVRGLGHLELLEYVRFHHNAVPRWAQYMVLYDLLGYLKEDQSVHGRVSWVGGVLADEFIEAMADILTLIDPETIEQIPTGDAPWIMRQALLQRFKGSSGQPRVFHSIEAPAGQTRATILHQGPLPELRANINGVAINARVTNTRLHTCLGQDFMAETELEWSTEEDVALWIDGTPVEWDTSNKVTWGRPPPASYRLKPADHTRPVWLRKIETAVRIVDIAALATGRSRLDRLLKIAPSLVGRTFRSIRTLTRL